MSAKAFLAITALTIGSVWVGVEIDPRRDAIAWLFLLALPVFVVSSTLYVSFRVKRRPARRSTRE